MVPVKVMVQLPEESVQLVALRDPVPVEEKFTVPVGMIAVPALEVSLTLAVQVDAWLAGTGLVQDMVVLVVRLFALMVAGLVVELAVWAWSPA